jgi:hypothetical protein
MGDCVVARIGGLLGVVLIAGVCINTLSTARAESVFDLVTDLNQAANSWSLDVPTGAAVLIINTNGRYTLRADSRAAPADRRWAAQVRQSMIVAERAGARFDHTVVARASMGVWSVRLKDGLSAVAATAPEALAFFLSASTEHTPTGDLEVITNALIDETTPASRVTAGATEIISVLPGAKSAVSADRGITVSIAKTTGLAQIKAASDVAPGYHQLFLYDDTSRFSPIASAIIKVASPGTVH